MKLYHSFVSSKADSADATLVRPSNWNAALKGGSLTPSSTDAYVAQSAAVTVTGSVAVWGDATGDSLIYNATDIFFYTSGSGRMQIGSGGYVLIGGTFGASFPLEIFTEFASTNSIEFMLNITRATSGVPAAGIGAALQSQIETAVGNFELGGRINFIFDDVTSTAEDSTIRFDITVAGSIITASWIPRVVRLSSGHTLASTTGTEVTGLQFTSVQPGTYIFTYYLLCQSSSATVGIGTGINFTGTATVTIVRREATTGTTVATGVIDDVSNVLTGAYYEARTAVAFSTAAPNMLNTGFITTGADCLVIIEGILVVTAEGDLEVWHSSETATNTTVSANSSGVLVRTN